MFIIDYLSLRSDPPSDLKRLQDVYRQRLGALRAAIQENAASSHQSRPTEAEVRNNKRPSHVPRRSGDFRIPRWGRASPVPVSAAATTSPKRTNGQYANILTSLQTLNATFGIWWECADLLVELSATGEEGATTTSHSTVSSAAPSAANSPDRMKYHSPLLVTATSPALANAGTSEERERVMRERAFTLVGLEKAALGNGNPSRFVHQRITHLKLLQVKPLSPVLRLLDVMTSILDNLLY
jgi:hypothetical protein